MNRIGFRSVVWIMLALLGPQSSRAAETETVLDPTRNGNCKVLPRDKRIVQMDFKPNSHVQDILGFVSTIGCRVVSFNAKDLEKKRLTLDTPERMSLEEVEALVKQKLAGVGLEVHEDGKPGGRESGTEGEKRWRIRPVVKSAR